MNAKQTIHKLRLVTSTALVGCVIVGALFSLFDIPSPFDPRIGGAAIGAAFGAFKFHLFV